MGDQEGTERDLGIMQGGERTAVGGKPLNLGVGTTGDGTSRRIDPSHISGRGVKNQSKTFLSVEPGSGHKGKKFSNSGKHVFFRELNHLESFDEKKIFGQKKNFPSVEPGSGHKGKRDFFRKIQPCQFLPLIDV